MVSALASDVVDGEFEPRSDQSEDYKTGMCCFSAKHACLREYYIVARAYNYYAEYRMLFSRRRGNECDIFEIALFRGSCIDVIKSRLRKNLKAPASSRMMPFLKEGEIRRRKKCSERLKEFDRNVGET